MTLGGFKLRPGATIVIASGEAVSATENPSVSNS